MKDERNLPPLDVDAHLNRIFELQNLVEFPDGSRITLGEFIRSRFAELEVRAHNAEAQLAAVTAPPMKDERNLPQWTQEQRDAAIAEIDKRQREGRGKWDWYPIGLIAIDLQCELTAVTEERDRLLDRVPERDQLIKAFVRGAKWWEFEKTGATMWQSDQNLAEAAAEKRFPATSPTDDRVEQVGPTVLEGILINALYEARCYVPTGTVACPIVEASIDTYEHKFPPRDAPPSGAAPQTAAGNEGENDA